MRRSTQILIRVSPSEKKAFDICAQIAGISTSAWIRERLRLIAAQELNQIGKLIELKELIYTTENIEDVFEK